MTSLSFYGSLVVMRFSACSGSSLARLGVAKDMRPIRAEWSVFATGLIGGREASLKNASSRAPGQFASAATNVG